MAPYDFSTIPEGQWRDGLFSCFTSLVPNCCMSYWLPCVTYSQVNARLGIEEFNKSLTKTFGIFGAIIVACIFMGIGVPALSYIAYVFYLLCIAAYVYLLISQRMHVRKRFNIEGSDVSDILIGWCCACCSLSQVATHVGSYQDGKCEFAAPPLYTVVHAEVLETGKGIDYVAAPNTMNREV